MCFAASHYVVVAVEVGIEVLSRCVVVVVVVAVVVVPWLAGPAKAGPCLAVNRATATVVACSAASTTASVELNSFPGVFPAKIEKLLMLLLTI